MNAYAGLTPRIHLNNLVSYLFGEQHNFYLTIQGRAAERLLLGALRDCKLVRNGDNVISNRPFDTTKGQILNHGLTVDALTPVASPDTYMNAEDPFMGNIDAKKLENYQNEKHRIVLLTLTDNGSGGQPVSVSNVKKVA